VACGAHTPGAGGFVLAQWIRAYYPTTKGSARGSVDAITEKRPMLVKKG
jgi:hypothetical protein